MDDCKKYQLNRLEAELIATLKFEAVQDALYERSVLEVAEIDEIKSQTSERRRIRLLVETIRRKDDNSAFDAFCDALQADYDWLAAQLLSRSTETTSEQPLRDVRLQMYEDAIIRGNVPRKPKYYVERAEYMNALKDALRTLKKGEYLTMHGMPHIGKTCLALGALYDQDFILQHFNNHVYWITFEERDRETEHDPIVDLVRIYDTVMMSGGGSGGASTAAPRCEASVSITDTLDIVRNRLRLELLKPQLRDTLLVLDGVHTKATIGAFDLGCKVLITTRDRTCTPSTANKYIEIKRCFTERETLLLFSKCLHVKLDALPIQTKQLYRLCRGDPGLIWRIGDHLDHNRQVLNDGRLNELLRLLKNKLPASLLIKEYISTLHQSFGACIDMLDANLQTRLRQLAIFEEGVNIMPTTLKALWRLTSVLDVQHIMDKLNSKSLVVRHYNQELDVYVYGIQDTLLQYLRQQWAADELAALHRRLVENYLAHATDGTHQYYRLPNDNYIYTYIGHHLSAGRMHHVFRDIYLDLLFVQSKIRGTGGPADLLNDYNKYRTHITSGAGGAGSTASTASTASSTSRYDVYVHFVRTFGQQINKYQHVHVAQYVFNHYPPHSLLHADAVNLVNARRLHRLYLVANKTEVNHSNAMNAGDSSSVCARVSDASAACFTHHIDYTLVGARSGDISLFYKSRHCVHTFRGHGSRIVLLMMHPTECDHFLSLCEGGALKVWSMRGILCRPATVSDEERRTPSPPARQPSWSDLHAHGDGDQQQQRTNDSLTWPVDADDRTCLIAYNQMLGGDYVITCVSVANDGAYTLIGTACGQVMLVNNDKAAENGAVGVDGVDGVVKHIERDEPITGPITTCKLSGERANTLMMYSMLTNLYIYDVHSMKSVMTLNDTDRIITFDCIQQQSTSTSNNNNNNNNSGSIVVLYDHHLSVWRWNLNNTSVVINNNNNNNTNNTNNTNNNVIGTDSIKQSVVHRLPPGSRRYTVGKLTLDGRYMLTLDSVNKVQVWGMQPASNSNDNNDSQPQLIMECVDYNCTIVCIDWLITSGSALEDAAADADADADALNRYRLLTVCGDDHCVKQTTLNINDNRSASSSASSSVQSSISNNVQLSGLFVCKYLKQSGNDKDKDNDSESESDDKTKLMCDLIMSSADCSRVYLYNCRRDQLDELNVRPATAAGGQRQGRVTHLAMSGQRTLVVGYSNGLVYECHLDTRKSDKIMKMTTHNDDVDADDTAASSIQYIECLSDGLLVASSTTGTLMVRKHHKNYKLTDGDPVVRSKLNNSSPIIKCYLFAHLDRFISITSDCQVKCYHYNNDGDVDDQIVLESVLISTNTSVVMSALAAPSAPSAPSALHNQLAFICKNNTVLVYQLVWCSPHHSHLDVTSSSSTALQRYHFKAATRLTTCSFTPSGELLIIGQHNGRIMLLNTLNGVLVHTLMGVSDAPVRSIHFSPPMMGPGSSRDLNGSTASSSTSFLNEPFIMVTVSDHIAFWDVNFVLERYRKHHAQHTSATTALQRLHQLNNGLSQRSAASSQRPLRQGQLHSPSAVRAASNSNSYSKYWSQLMNVRELCGCIKLCGSRASHVVASDDFTSFTAVDNIGTVYLMHVFDDHLHTHDTT